MIALADAAIGYAELSIAVFPLTPRDKKPLPYSTGLFAASADASLALGRWNFNVPLPVRAPKFPGERLPKEILASPRSNVACATGEISGFWVLDLDGAAAEEDLAKLVAVHGPLPETVEQATGNGRHLCFAWDPAFAIRNSASKIGRGIDVRGDGGYIVLPPSIHPSGRVYAWTPGHAPGELAFAAAPEWLMKLAMPAEAPAHVAPAKARVHEDGRASRFGEAVLTTACRMISTAPAGKQQESLWGYACQVGGFVAGGEIERDYAKRSLMDAGRRMTPAGKPWSEKDLDSHIERGLDVGVKHPRTAPEQRSFEPSARRERKLSQGPSAADQAGAVSEVRALWNRARPADCALVRSWFRVRGLDAQALPGALAGLRAVQDAPGAGASLLIPLFEDPGDMAAVDALAVLPLNHDHIAGFMGPYQGRVAFLTPWPAAGALLVALDLADAWALGVNAHDNGHELGVVLAPTIGAFAGGSLGDKWGRVDPRTPYADPEAAPWTAPPPPEGEERAVFVAVRGDLRTPELKSRKTFGGTDRQRLEGEAAARFYAGLVEQAWRGAGANQVRIVRPSGGAAGFNSSAGGA